MCGPKQEQTFDTQGINGAGCMHENRLGLLFHAYGYKNTFYCYIHSYVLSVHMLYQLMQDRGRSDSPIFNPKSFSSDRHTSS